MSVTKAIDAVFGLRDEFSGNMAKIISSMEKGQKEMNRMGRRIEWQGRQLKNAGDTMTKAFTVPIVTGLGASVKAAIDWETAFTGVTKTVDATAEQYEALAEGIKKMSEETASSKEEIASVAEVAGQLGVEADNILDFTKTMIMLGDTTNLSAEEAATSLARFTNIASDVTNADVSKLGSAIVDLGNNFATSESEIVEMSTRLASAGTVAGLSSTDILALSAAMSSVGIQAEAGGTAMTQTMTALTQEVANFSAGAENNLNRIAQIAGISAQEFADTWNKNPVKAIQAFIAGLGNLDQQGENATLVLDELGMSGVRQENMLLALASASDVLSDAVDTSSAAFSENSALEAEAEKRYQTMAAQLSQLKEKLSNLAITYGEMLMPYVKAAVEKIEAFTAKLEGMSKGQRKAILTIALLAASFGPVLSVTGRLTMSFGRNIKTISKVIKATKSIRTVFNSHLTKAFVSGAVKADKFGKGLRSVTAKTGKAFTSFGLKIASAGKTGAAKFMSGLRAIPGGLSKLAGGLKKFGSGAVSTFVKIGGKFAKTLRTVGAGIRVVGTALKSAFMNPVGLAILAVVALAAATYMIYKNWDKVKVYFKKVWSFVTGTFNKAITWVKQNCPALYKVVKTQINGIKTIVNGLKTVFNGIITFVKGVFTGNWRKAWKGVRQVFSSVFSGFANLFKIPMNGVITILNKAIEKFNSLANGISDKASAAGFSGVATAAKKVIINKIKPLATGTENWAGGLAQVSEKGGEIIDLPRGSRVYPHDESVAMARREGSTVVNVNIGSLAESVIVREEADIEKIAAKFAAELKKVLANRGGEVVFP